MFDAETNELHCEAPRSRKWRSLGMHPKATSFTYGHLAIRYNPLTIETSRFVRHIRPSTTRLLYCRQYGQNKNRYIMSSNIMEPIKYNSFIFFFYFLCSVSPSGYQMGVTYKICWAKPKAAGLKNRMYSLGWKVHWICGIINIANCSVSVYWINHSYYFDCLEECKLLDHFCIFEE